MKLREGEVYKYDTGCGFYIIGRLLNDSYVGDLCMMVVLDISSPFRNLIGGEYGYTITDDWKNIRYMESPLYKALEGVK